VELKGKRAFVTGGGHGLGRAIAEALCAEGASVTVCGRSEAALDETAQALTRAGAQAFSVVCDVSNADAVRDAVRAAEAKMGGVDLLINNAGIAPTAPLSRMSLEMWNQAFAVNATGAFLCTQACVPGMLERRFGRIVNVASVAGISSGPYLAAYSASKHAMVGLTRATAAELGGRGIQANAVCPAYVDTDMTRGGVVRAMQKGLSEAEALERVLASAGQQRLLPVSEVTAWVTLLCGSAGNAMNGQVIVLDGGGKEP
jgi:NAD(P)-dependent dehydrogenase (short-subunit alcohol dehydrogenase family)